jgi:hypothetical protein
MAAGLYFITHERLGLFPLASREVERRAQVGEGVSRPELLVRLVEVKADDRPKRQRRDCGEEQDVSGSGRPPAGQQDGEVDRGQGAEEPGPCHIGDEERIPRA